MRACSQTSIPTAPSPPTAKRPLRTCSPARGELGISYYGIAEHFDYDYLTDGILAEGKPVPMIDAAAYFSQARRLQTAYAPQMRVLAGGEFGYTANPDAHALYASTIAQFSPRLRRQQRAYRQRQGRMVF